MPYPIPEWASLAWLCEAQTHSMVLQLGPGKLLEMTSPGRHFPRLRKNISGTHIDPASNYASRMFEVENVNAMVVTLKMSLWLSG